MRSSPFDDDDGSVEERPLLPESSIWRRPWWRWNLFTLFGVLFTFVWLRELQRWSLVTTVAGTFWVFVIWGVVPVIPNLIDACSKVMTLTSEAIKKHRNEPKPPKFMLLLAARWIAVLVCLGAIIQCVAMIGNMMSLMSMRSVSGFLYGGWQVFVQITYAIANGIFHLGLSIALWMLADILQNQEEGKAKQKDSEQPTSS